MNDYYYILDIPTTATHEQIRAQYKQLVRIYHPDRFTDALDKAFVEEKLKQINIAYQVLSSKVLQTGFEGLPELRPQPKVDPPRIEIGPLPIGTKTVCRFQVNNLGAETRSMNFTYSTEDDWFRVSKSRRIYVDKPFPLEFELMIHTQGLAPAQQYEEWLTVDLDGSTVCIPLILKVEARKRHWFHCTWFLRNKRDV